MYKLSKNLSPTKSTASAHSILNNMIDTIMVKLDSGATRHYFKQEHQHLLHDLRKLDHGPEAQLPDNSIVKATYDGIIALHPLLSKEAQRVLIYPELKNESLLSVGQLTNDGCSVTFSEQNVTILKNNTPILHGTRNRTDNLYDVPIRLKNQMNLIIRQDQTKTDLAKFLHATAFSPAISTFQKAIRKGNFVTWPGIASINFEKILPTTLATEQGHLDQERKNLQSQSLLQNEDDNFPEHIPEKTHNRFITLTTQYEGKNKHKGYMDLTGRFPHTSSRGNKYFVVVYDYDTNAIVFEPIRKRQAKEILTAFLKCQDKIAQNYVTPKLYILDNEASSTLKQILTTKGQKYELVPPNMHRRNAVEKAIRTFKNHLISGLATCDPEFPVHEWDRILPQCEITLNLLRNSRINPNLSSWATIKHIHDFNKWPMAPPGSKILIHSKPNKRSSWAYHGQSGWYVGPSTEHYRCVKCYVPKTHTEIISDTVRFIPTHIPIPNASINDHIRKTLEDLTLLLQDKVKTFPPSVLSETNKQALITLASMFNRNDLCDGHSSSEGGVKREKTPPAHHQLQSTGHGKLQSTNNQNFDQLIQQYQTIPSQRPTVLPPPPPRIPYPSRPFLQYNVPIPKRQVQSQVNPFPTEQPTRPGGPFPKAFSNHQFHTPYAQMAINHLIQNETRNKLHHIFDPAGKRLSLDQLLQSNNAKIWQQATSNELGRLAQGLNNVQGNEVIEFITKSEVPCTKKVTYANMVCDFRPLKAEPFRVRLTVGGDRLDYERDAASPAASLLETKLLINSVISQSAKGCRFMTLDIKDFFLQTDMQESEYMRINSKYFFKDIKDRYNLHDKINADGFVYCRIKKGMYGLKQAARLAYDDLKEHLAKYGYKPDPIATNIWSHDTKQTKFCLCVDDCGVQYFNDADAQHLIDALKNKYDITIDKKGTNFCGLRLEWNYSHGFVDIAMPKYVQKTLKKLNYEKGKHNQYAPHKWTVPVYGKKQQFVTPEDTTKLLDKKGVKYTQRVVGSFLYYGRAVDNTILTALNEISAAQAQPTEKTKEKIQMLLDYLNTYPNAKIRFYASDMKLHIDSDAAYLVAPKAKSRIAGFFYCSNKTTPQSPQPFLNGPVHIECRVLRHVVTSAAEAETAALFYNAQTALELVQILNALGHPQHHIPIKTDNVTASSFVTSTIKQKRSKAWDVRYHWLSEQQAKKKFHIFWDKGANNLADYHTKHHPPSYHKKVREKYILRNFFLSTK